MNKITNVTIDVTTKIAKHITNATGVETLRKFATLSKPASRKSDKSSKYNSISALQPISLPTPEATSSVL